VRRRSSFASFFTEKILPSRLSSILPRSRPSHPSSVPLARPASPFCLSSALLSPLPSIPRAPPIRSCITWWTPPLHILRGVPALLSPVPPLLPSFSRFHMFLRWSSLPTLPPLAFPARFLSTPGDARGHGPYPITNGERILLSAWLKQGRDWLTL
jgi:hypothetical protein